MKKLMLLISLPLIFLSSCKKEETDDEQPVVSVDKPLENAVVNLGESIDYEGIAYDNKELSTLNIEISSPDASYDYNYCTSIDISGSSVDFHEWLTIPSYASVGNAELKIYAVDLHGNKSNQVKRTIQIRDKIDPQFNISSTLVEDSDSLIFTLYKNDNGVFDSITVYNYTKSAQLFTATDVGGFRNLLIRRETPSSNDVQYVAYDLRTITDQIHVINFTVDLDGTISQYMPYLDITFVEYRVTVDGPLYTSADNGHHMVHFDVIP